MYVLFAVVLLFAVIVCGNCSWRQSVKISVTLALLPVLGVIAAALSSGVAKQYYYVALPLVGLSMGIQLLTRWVTRPATG